MTLVGGMIEIAKTERKTLSSHVACTCTCPLTLSCLETQMDLDVERERGRESLESAGAAGVETGRQDFLIVPEVFFSCPRRHVYSVHLLARNPS